MIHQTTALFFVLCLLAIFEIVTAETEKPKAGNATTPASGVATFSALGALATTVLANLF